MGYVAFDEPFIGDRFSDAQHAGEDTEIGGLGRQLTIAAAIFVPALVAYAGIGYVLYLAFVRVA